MGLAVMAGFHGVEMLLTADGGGVFGRICTAECRKAAKIFTTYPSTGLTE
jgi:hypothetical protein